MASLQAPSLVVMVMLCELHLIGQRLLVTAPHWPNKRRCRRHRLRRRRRRRRDIFIRICSTHRVFLSYFLVRFAAKCERNDDHNFPLQRIPVVDM